MQKAIYFEDAYKSGILGSVDSGYILSIKSPDFDKLETKNDPFLIEMVSYSGVKSITPMGNGLKFQAQGKKMFCLLEPSAYTEKHVEPTYRDPSSTGHIPFRYADCEKFLTKDSKFTVLIPNLPQDCYDSFTITLPEKGDLCILYMIFDKDINKVVLPFIRDNFQTILKKLIGMTALDSKKVAEDFTLVIKKFDVWADEE